MKKKRPCEVLERCVIDKRLTRRDLSSLLLVTCIGLLGRRWGSSKPEILLFRMCNPICSLLLQCCTFPCSSSVLHWVSRFRDASLFLLYCVGGPSSTVTTFGCHCDLLFAALYHWALYLIILNYHTFIAEYLGTFILKYILVPNSESGIWINLPILYSYFSCVF